MMKRYTSRPWYYLPLKATVALFFAASATLAQPSNLFRPTDKPLPGAAANVMDSRAVNVDLDLLASVQPGHTMALNLFRGKPFIGDVVEAEGPVNRGRLVRGTIQGRPGSSFTFVRRNNAVVGIVRFAGTPHIYELRSIGNGTSRLARIDASKYAPELCFTKMPDGDNLAPDGDAKAGKGQAPVPAQSADDTDTPNSNTQNTGTEADPAAAPACAPLPITLDVMLVYTPAARMAMDGTHDTIIAQCQLALAVTNQVYQNSQIIPRARLVHCTEINRTEANDMENDLGWLATSQTIKDLRDTYAADFVSMIISYGSGYGYCGGPDYRAYSVVKWDRAVNTWSLAHEIGHNQACEHNREDAGCGVADGYGYGHYFNGNSGTQWGTVMSYIGTRISNISNPNVLFDGQPTGVPIGQSGEAYNAYRINGLAPWHESYRLTRYDVWADFDRLCFFSTVCNGAYDTPFNNLADAVDGAVNGENTTAIPTVWIKSSTTDETMTLDRPMVLRVCDGPATIGLTP